MDALDERISAWEHAGLIDGETAGRLRAAEATRSDRIPREIADAGRSRAPSATAQVFGTAPTIGEMFGFLGGAFLLGAFDAFLVRTAGFEGDAALATGFAFATVVLIAI